MNTYLKIAGAALVTGVIVGVGLFAMCMIIWG